MRVILYDILFAPRKRVIMYVNQMHNIMVSLHLNCIFKSFARNIKPMNKRQYYLFRAWSFTGLTLFVAGLLLFVDTDEFGKWAAVILGLIFAYKAYTFFKAAKSAVEESTPYRQPGNTTTEQQLKYYRDYIKFSIFLFSTGTIYIIWQLNSLANGSKENVMLWEPLAFIYTKFGYWVTVAALPVAGMLFLLPALFNLSKFKVQIKTQDQEQNAE